jgi:hypothetical protein
MTTGTGLDITHAKPFDASRYLTKLKGKDYLEVKWRLLWLRTEHPEATINTELVKLEDGFAMFKATVRIPAGGEATGWGTETASDFGDFIEKAETKALGRALAALGFGTQFCEDFAFDDDGRGAVVDSPVQRPAPAPTKPAPKTTPIERATPAQQRAIYSLARKHLTMSEEELDERARQIYGTVPALLTKRQASEMISNLQQSARAAAAS